MAQAQASPSAEQPISHIGRDHCYRHVKQMQPCPSTRDGIDPAQLQTWKQSNRFFITRLCIGLKLVPSVEWTANYILTRFFAKRSMLKNDRFLVCSAAVFLAAKTLESPRPLGDVAYRHFELRNANKPEEMDELRRLGKKGPKVAGLMEDLLLAERALLYTLEFDVGGYMLLSATGLYLAAVGAHILKPYPADQGEPAVRLPEPVQTHLTKLSNHVLQGVFKTELPLRFTATQAGAACVRYAAECGGIQLQLPTAETRPLGPGNQPLGPGYEITDEEFEEFKTEHKLLLKQPAKPEPTAAKPEPTADTSKPDPASSPLPSRAPCTPLLSPGAAAAISLSAATTTTGFMGFSTGATPALSVVGGAAPVIAAPVTAAPSLEEGELPQAEEEGQGEGQGEGRDRKRRRQSRSPARQPWHAAPQAEGEASAGAAPQRQSHSTCQPTFHRSPAVLQCPSNAPVSGSAQHIPVGAAAACVSQSHLPHIPPTAENGSACAVDESASIKMAVPTGLAPTQPSFATPGQHQSTSVPAPATHSRGPSHSSNSTGCSGGSGSHVGGKRSADEFSSEGMRAGEALVRVS
eukprot:CAMPEP_0119102422 /NCGR_PEP_ID=MMETSP1180-20130426/1179_1 /TAXON_ID=3052 ORGANISM="Chlamydomonas cf sp, Strain CCMP681" /NCGR_SAMPLE_ID=MMETSP1180 /ASSEMBLY_ACC=CAM_ASM_000741 /LENGTH=576 /DNA_ID=CAMNT_0007086715 /DNA_START=13 /DNA_END=1743 /DNA_ORIENTATION=-